MFERLLHHNSISPRLTSLPLQFQINNGVLPISALDTISDSTSNDTTADGQYVLYTQRYYDRYPGHSPLYCMTWNNTDKCGIFIGGSRGTFAAPVLVHYGNNGAPCNWYNPLSFFPLLLFFILFFAAAVVVVE
jgi:hypothetical protein